MFFSAQKVFNFADRLIFLLGLVSVVAMVAKFGFYLAPDAGNVIAEATRIIVVYFVCQECLRFIFVSDRLRLLRERLLEVAIVFVSLFYFFWPHLIMPIFRIFVPDILVEDITLFYLGITQSLVTLNLLIKFVRSWRIASHFKWRSSQIFVLSFLFPIAIGTLLLKLPRAQVIPISWVDALFTVTSAFCVTGLTVVDTGQAFSPLGKFLIGLFFQIGGLGIMTLTTFFAVIFSGAIGVKERILMSDLLSEERIGEIKKLLARICGLTLLVELSGAVLLYISTGATFVEFDRSVFYASLFHAISAFCNAGFSLFSQSLYDQAMRNNYVYAFVIAVLIIIGGLGFPVLMNMGSVLRKIFGRERRYHILTMTSRLVLVATAVLIIGGTLVIWLCERNQSLAQEPLSVQIFQSFFLSVTSRTAGFNLWPTEAWSAATALVVIILMWIGASPMSTGGGVKNITIAVALLNLRRQIRGIRQVDVFGRQITDDSVSRAFAIITISLFTLLLGFLILVILEPRINRFDLLFETVSAWGTVGLSRGITSSLSVPAKLILVVLMFVGRVGMITVLSCVVADLRGKDYRYLRETLIVS